MDKFNKKNQKQPLSRKLGDKIERAGDKLKDLGATKIGQVVYDAGDKLEHSKDNKK